MSETAKKNNGEVKKAPKDELLDLGDIGLAIIGATQRELTIDIKDLCVAGTFEKDFDTVFKFRHPSLMDRANIGVKYRRSLDGVDQIDVITGEILWTMATLDTVCSRVPDWFNIETMSDSTLPVLSLLYKKYNEWVDSFRKSIAGKDENETTVKGDSD